MAQDYAADDYGAIKARMEKLQKEPGSDETWVVPSLEVTTSVLPRRPTASHSLPIFYASEARYWFYRRDLTDYLMAFEGVGRDWFAPLDGSHTASGCGDSYYYYVFTIHDAYRRSLADRGYVDPGPYGDLYTRSRNTEVLFARLYLRGILEK